MKVISKIDPEKWRKTYKCIRCESILEIVTKDLSTEKEVIGYNDGHSCGIVPTGKIDVFFFMCSVCGTKCKVEVPFFIEKHLTK